MGEEQDHLQRTNGTRKETEVVPPFDSCHSRKRLPVEVVLQHWCLSFRRPGAAAMRPLAQSALVDEDDGPTFLAGFFFNLQPGLLFPLADFLLTPLQRPARRTLATPAQLPQNAPSLRRVTLHPTFPFDQISHAPGCPKCGLKTKRLRPTFQASLDALQVLGAQTRFAPGATRLAQRPLAALFQLPRPTAYRLPMRSHPPR